MNRYMWFIMKLHGIPTSSTSEETQKPLEKGIRPGMEFEGRLFKKSDSLHKKQIGVEKGILQIEEKIRTSDPEEARSLKVELKQLQRLRYTLVNEQKRVEHSVIGRICSIWKYFVSSAKHFTIPQKHLSSFQKHVEKVFGQEVVNFGEGNIVRLVRAGDDLSYADLIDLTKHKIERDKRLSLPTDDADDLLEYLNKTQPHIDQHISKKQFVAKKLRHAFSAKKTDSQSAKPTAHSKRMDAFFNSKAIRTIKETGLYLIRSDSRVTVTGDQGQELMQKMKILVRLTFPGEIQVGKPQTSLFDKTNIEFTKDGKQLSKAELVEITIAKIQDIQKKLESTEHGRADPKEIRKLQKKLVTAEQLVKVLLDENVVEYLSTKREALFAVIKGIAFLSSTINSLILLPWTAYDKWDANKAFKKLSAPYSRTRSDEELKILQGKIESAIKLLSKKDDSFEKAFKEIIAERPSNQRLVSQIFSHKNRALVGAMKESNMRAVHFIIETGSFKGATKDTLEALYNMTNLPPEGTLLLLKDLFDHCTDNDSLRRMVGYLMNTGEADFAEKLVLGALDKEKGNMTLAADGTPKLSEKHIACLHQAAKIGTDTVLKSAFGITEESSLEQVVKAVKPYVFLPDPDGETLLGYACSGKNAQFVTALNLAIKEKYLEVADPKALAEKIRALADEIAECKANGAPDAYIEALENKFSNLSGPAGKENYRQVKKRELEGLLSV